MFERACARVPVCQHRGVLRNLSVRAAGRGVRWSHARLPSSITTFSRTISRCAAISRSLGKVPSRLTPLFSAFILG